MTDAAALLAAYDSQLRTTAETVNALSTTRFGPLWLATYGHGRGFVTYRDLTGPDGTPADAAAVHALVAAAARHFFADPAITEVEWKTRAHDSAPGLHEALTQHGFQPAEPESIMIGEVRHLVVDVPLPDGVAIRRITAEADVRAMAAMVGEVFGDPPTSDYADELLRRQARDPAMELWVAEADGVVVTAGRLDPVQGTDFASIWGGATRPEWRGQGVYRAVTAARARAALTAGKRYVHSDSTEYSRPILERSGLLKVSETTPYTWRRHADG